MIFAYRLSARILIAGIVILSAAAARATVADRAFETLRANPPFHPGQFDFVVVGDTRSTEPVVLPPEFFQMIGEWNLLKPAFVVDGGDLILGGAAEGLDPQWTEFERAAGLCDAPFFPVAGNHDISDPATEQIYESRIGPLTYAFSYGNSRFIVLNTEEQGAAGRISDAQVTWLKDDLGQSKANNIFLFLHQPYFAGDWDANWANVAEVFQGHPVRVVFGSHEHCYRYWGERDGVRYVITGGGGAERRTAEEDGGFVHYLLVRVRGAQVDWIVVRPGSLLSPEVVTQARIDEKRAMAEAFSIASLEVPMGQPLDQTAVVQITSPEAASLAGTLHWELPPRWRIDPIEMPYAATPGQTVSLPFHVWTESNEPAGFPVPQFTATLPGVEENAPVTLTKDLPLAPTAISPYATEPVFLDGALTEWAAAAPLPLSYAFGFNISEALDLQAQLRLMWDEGHVYLAVETEDDEFHQPYAGDIVWSADNVQVFLEDWEWSLTLTSQGEEVFLYRGPGREAETVNTAVRLAVKRDGRRTVYEAAFPVSEVTPARLFEGNSYRLAVVVNDLDPGVPARPRHWAELTPGWGDVGRGPMLKVMLASPPTAPAPAPPSLPPIAMPVAETPSAAPSLAAPAATP